MLTPEEKEKALLSLLNSYTNLAVAYSGGVDSTYLADCAHQALGEQKKIIMDSIWHALDKYFKEAL